MKSRRLFSLMAGMLCLAASGFADTIASGSGTWQPFPTTLTQGVSNTAYFDNASQDGNQKGVGFFVTGQSGYPNSPGFVNPPWLGGSGALGMPSSILFNSTGQVKITVLLHSTGNADDFGFFDATQPGNPVTKLFDTNTAVGSSVILTLPGTYGFYLHYTDPNVGTDYYKSNTAASITTEAPGHQHFVVFIPTLSATPQDFVVGTEDGWGTVHPAAAIDEKVGDYNDFVIRISAVPEPATFGFIAFGLGSMAFFRRRK